MRLDKHIANLHPDVSRSTWQKHIANGAIRINGTTETSTKRELTEDDTVEISLPEEPDFSASSLPVLYEDDNVIVIDKPVGVLTHSKGELNDEFTVADFVRPKTTYKADTNRPGIIHRLDRDTSGVIICAKNDEAAHVLLKQFQDRKAKKTYYAVVDGILKLHSADIDLPIERNPKQPSSFRVGSSGKSAQTRYEVLDSNATKSLVKLMPTTGRTHQLRVHMAYLNAPIHGDRVYGEAADRLYLHAAQLEITIPPSNRVAFESAVPEIFSTSVQ